MYHADKHYNIIPIDYYVLRLYRSFTGKHKKCPSVTRRQRMLNAFFLKGTYITEVHDNAIYR